MIPGVGFAGGVNDSLYDGHYYTYVYSYNAAGRVTSQISTVMATTGNNYNNLQPVYPPIATFTAGYQWDDEGRMTSMQSPTVPMSSYSSYPNPVVMPTMGYQYDINGRMTGMTSNSGGGPQTFATATYGAAGQLLTLAYGGMTETRTYNGMMQLITQYVPGYLNMTYNYSLSQNNGRITSSVDGITGESTTYAYDALNRLTNASNSLWSEAYGYDGFGNLTSKSGSGGSPNHAPSMTATYNANNQQSGVSYDSDGKVSSAPGYSYGYSVENKMTSQTSTYYPNGGTFYGYDPWGKRVMKETNPDPNDYEGEYNPFWEFYFYTITGQRLVTMDCNNPNGHPVPSCWVVGENAYFGSKLLVSNGVNVVTDRLGTVRANTQGESFAYYPYGEERTTRPDGRDKFATYFRDAVGQDYADQRYYGSGTGRFWSPDPGGIKTADAGSPLSWNRYAYVQGDPTNGIDRHGLEVEAPSATDCIQDPDYCQQYDWDSSYGCYGDGDGFLGEPDPGCQTGGGSQQPPATPPPPNCNQILTNDITTYLGSYGGGKSPLDTSANIQALVTAGMTYDVDPRFIVALAVAESSAGINLTWGPYNAWNIRARSPKYDGPGKKPPYTSWEQAINAVNDLISGAQYFGAGLTTTSTIYPLYQGPGYETGLANINAALGQMKGNQNQLTDPCSTNNPRAPNQ